MKDLYKKYILSEGERFAKDALSKAQIDFKIDSDDVVELSENVGIVALSTNQDRSTEYSMQCRFFEGIVPVFNLLWNKPNNANSLIHCISDEFYLSWLFSDVNDYTWDLLNSPKLSREKLLQINNGYELTKVCYSLLLDQSAWTPGKCDDASWMFKE
jgi:hypothetical protein